MAFGEAERKDARAPELERLRADARAGQVRKLYVFCLDRFSRSGSRDTFEVIQELRAARVELVSVSDGFALDGPAAEVVLAVMAWAAKMERLAIGERIAASRERLEAEGRPWGRPPRLTPLQRERALELASAGMSVRRVAQAVGAPRSVVHRALSRKPAAAKAA